MDVHTLYWGHTFGAGILALLLAAYLFPRRRKPSAWTLMWLMLCLAVWALGYAMEFRRLLLADKLWWVKTEYFGAVWVAPLFLILGKLMVQQRAWLTRKRLLLLAVVPVLTLVQVWTNDLYHLIWSHAWLDLSGDLPIIVFIRTAGYWVFIAYSYALLLWATAILAKGFIRARGLQRRQLGTVLLGLVMPWLANIVYNSGLGPANKLDLTPVTFTLSGMAIAWGLFRYQLLDISSLARKTIMGSLPDAVLVFDTDDRLVDLNTAAELFFSEILPKTKGQPRVRLLPGLNIPSDLDRGEVFQNELVLGRGDGGLRTFHVHVSVLEDRRRGEVGSLVILRDITDRKRADESLRDSEKRHRRFLEQLPDPIVVYDMNGKMIYINPAFEKTFGWDRTELYDRQIEFVPAEAHNETVESVAQMMRGQPVRDFESQRLTKDGRVLQVHINTEPFHGAAGEQAGNIVLLRDVTGLKQFQDSLRASEERNRAILEAAADPIVVYDMEGLVVYFNPAFVEVFGWLLEERLGKKMDHFVPEEAWAETKEMIAHVMAGKSFTGIESLRYNSDGELIPVSMSGAIYHNDEGNPVGSVITLRDIRETKKLESQLLHAQKMEAIGTLAGGVAHEFNNILMAIRGYTQLLIAKGNQESYTEEYLERIDQSTARAADLTKNMLSFSRLETGEKEAVDVTLVVSVVQRLLSQTLPVAIKLEAELTPELPPVLANANQLEQVFLNLALNARDAMPNGGRITFRTAIIEADEAFCRTQPWASQKPYLVVSVQDTGTGISPEAMERVFEPFFTTKEPGKGTGLGLSVVYSVINNHQGGISLESTSGVGTTFHIYLPAQTEAVQADRKQEGADPLPDGADPLPDGAGQRILVVDDEAAVREIVEQALQTVGYQPQMAANGKQALEAYQEAVAGGNSFDLVIMDLSMPVMDGYECCRRLLEMDPKVKVIIATGHIEQESLEGKLDASQIGGVLQKPYDLSSLLKTVQSNLSG